MRPLQVSPARGKLVMHGHHSITQENKLGTRFIEASDFLKNGIPASILATFVSAPTNASSLGRSLIMCACAFTGDRDHWRWSHEITAVSGTSYQALVGSH